MTTIQRSAIEEAANERFAPTTQTRENMNFGFRKGAQEVIDIPDKYGLTTRKPLGIQEACELVNQMLAEEISFSRFVELINEGGNK